MYNKKEWVSNELITKEALNNIENGVENNNIEIDKLLSNRNSIILNTEHFFDFSNIGNDSIADTALINEIFAYSKEHGYNYILFPKEKTFLIEPTAVLPAIVTYSVEFPTDTVINLNYSTLKIREDYNESVVYYAFGFERDCKNTIIMNGVIQGNKYTSPHKDSGNSNTETIYFSGYNNKFINIHIKETLGDGIVFDGPHKKSTMMKTEFFTNIDLSSGSEIENPCVLTTDYLLFDSYFLRNGDMFIESNYAGINAGENGSLHWKVCYYVYYLYNENKELLKSYTTQRFEAVYREMIPEDTYYVRLSMISPKPMSAFPNHLYIMSQDIPRYCELINCKIDDSSRNGITVGCCAKCAVRNSIICNSERYAPQYGIDIEPEFGACDGFVVESCYFFNNHAGDFVAGKFRNVQVLNNRFYGNVAIQGFDFIFKNNIINGGGGFTLGTVDENVPFAARGLIEHNIFFNQNLTTNVLLTIDNCIFRDNYVYNINQIRGEGYTIIEDNEIYAPEAKTNYKGISIIARRIVNNNIYSCENIVIESNVIDSNTFNKAITISQSYFTNDRILNITNNKISVTSNSFGNYPIQYWAHQYKMIYDVVNITGNTFLFGEEKTNNKLFNILLTKDIIFNIIGNYSDFPCYKPGVTESGFNVTINDVGNFNLIDK